LVRTEWLRLRRIYIKLLNSRSEKKKKTGDAVDAKVGVVESNTLTMIPNVLVVLNNLHEDSKKLLLGVKFLLAQLKFYHKNFFVEQDREARTISISRLSAMQHEGC
jgi:hypothetical protein